MIQHRPIWWFPFDPREWITVCASNGLSVAAQGVFIRLLCHQWINYYIPQDLSKITAILNYDGEGVTEVLKLFRSCRNYPRAIYYPPLEDARHEAIIKSNKLRAAGKKGAEKRYHSKKAHSGDNSAVTCTVNASAPTPEIARL